MKSRLGDGPDNFGIQVVEIYLDRRYQQAGARGGVEGIPRYLDGEGCHERVHCEGAEQIGDLCQPLEETVETVTLFPRERVRQLTAEQIGDVPQMQEETVDEKLLVPR